MLLRRPEAHDPGARLDEPDLVRALSAERSAERRAAIRSALLWWEPRRWIYNLVLVGVVVVRAIELAPGSAVSAIAHDAAALFFLAVLANVAYCAAYVPDLFVRAGGLADAWRWFRPTLFAVGTAFAAVLAYSLADGLFPD